MDAKANGDYTVASNFANASLSVEGWIGSDLVTNRLINAERIAGTNGTVKIKTTAKQASALYPGISIPNTLDRMIEDKQNDVDSGNAGIKFLSRALEPQFLAEGEVLPTIDGAAQLAYAGGVQASTVAVAQAPVRATCRLPVMWRKRVRACMKMASICGPMPSTARTARVISAQVASTRGIIPTSRAA